MAVPTAIVNYLPECFAEADIREGAIGRLHSSHDSRERHWTQVPETSYLDGVIVQL
jgi:hypothetical protein